MRRWDARVRVRAKGLTLAEVVLAMGILAFLALLVVGVFLALLKSSAKNREQAMAELLTEKFLEKAAAEGPPDWGVGKEKVGTRLEEEPLELDRTAGKELDRTRFFYQVDSELLETEPKTTAGATWRITVTVGWWLAKDAPKMESSRVGFGNQYVRGVRTIYWRQGEAK